VGDVQPGEVSAKYENGILKISLPKREKKELPQSTGITIG
jgi:HSP20 family molecular chaperone IbpA